MDTVFWWYARFGSKRHGYVYLQTCKDRRADRVIARTMRRSRGEDFISGMNRALRPLPSGLGMHVILESSPAHESKRTRT